jgi:hypothetical protein
MPKRLNPKLFEEKSLLGKAKKPKVRPFHGKFFVKDI